VCIEPNTDSFINHKLSSFVLLVPPTVLDLIARTISGLAYKSRMITEKAAHTYDATRESSTNVSQKSGKICKYVDVCLSATYSGNFSDGSAERVVRTAGVFHFPAAWEWNNYLVP